MPELGYWERDGKSPVLGALLGTTLIAALYSMAGSLAMSAYMIGDLMGNPGGLAAKSWEEARRLVMSRYRVPILGMTIAFEFAFFVMGTLILFRAWHRVSLRERFRLGLPAPEAMLFAVVGAAGLFPLALFAGETFERVFPFLKELQKSSEGLLAASDPGSWAFLVAAICVTPAFCEEFLFRGYFQGTLSRGMPSPWSWLLTGSCFALVHQNYIGLGALLVIGIYLSFVFDAGGSLWPGSLTHFLYNGSVILLATGTVHPAWAFDDSGFVRLRIVAAGLPIAAIGIAALLLTKKKRIAGKAA